MHMRRFLLGALFVIVLVIGGLIYRNAVEHPTQPITCPLDTLLCPDGTSVSRTGLSCTFPACPPPNVSIPSIAISFALPEGLQAVTPPDAASVAAYELSPSASATASSTNSVNIIIRRYMIDASSTALATIQQTAVDGVSGLPVAATSFSSTLLGNHRFTVVSIQRFDGIVDTAYYLARGTDVLRFDAIDQNIANWADPNLDTSILPAHAALKSLLTTLQGQ